MRGQSLTDVVIGGAPTRSIVFSEHMYAQMVAARSLRGTLIWHRKSSRQFPSYPLIAGKMELYDRSTDPEERHSLPTTDPLYDELKPALERYLGEGLLLAARRAQTVDKEALKALGYIE